MNAEEQKRIEDRLKMLENSVLSLNTLWKMAVLLQGPTFTSVVVKNLDNMLSDSPKDAVIQDARNDLAKSAELWGEEAEGPFGLERLEMEVEAIQARQIALQFITFLNTLQHGPPGMAAMLQALENRKMRDDTRVSEAFQVATSRVFEYFRSEIESALKAYVKQTVDEETKAKEEVSHVH